MVRPASRMFSAISFGVFWRSAPSTSAIIRSRNVSPGIRGHPDRDPVRQHPRAAGDRRSIAARLADDRRRLARDRRLVHRRDALDDLAVAGNELARLDEDDVARAQARRGHRLGRRRRRAAAWPSSRSSRLPQRVGLGLAAAFGHRLGEVGEEHGEPQPERDLQLEAEAGPRPSAASRASCDRRQHAARPRRRTSPGLRIIGRGFSLRTRVDERAADDARGPRSTDD